MEKLTMNIQTMKNSSPQSPKMVGRFLIVSFSTVLVYLTLSLIPTPFNFQEETENRGRSGENSVGYLAGGLISGFGFSGLYLLQIYKRNKEKLSQLKQRLEEQRQKLSALENQLEEKKQSHQTLNTALAEKDQKLVEYKQELEQKQELAQKLEQQESQYLQELDNLMQVEDELRQQLNEQDQDYTEQIEELLNTKSLLEGEITEQRDRVNRIQQKLQTKQEALKKASQNYLSPFKITLVGGHQNACQEVAKILQEQYGVKECNIIPQNESLPNNPTIKSKTKDADIIFVITGYNGHALSEKVYKLYKAGHLKGKLIHLSKIRGASGLVKEILDNFEVPTVLREKVA